MRMVAVAAVSMFAGVAGLVHSAQAMSIRAGTPFAKPFVQQVERTCNVQGICWNKYTGEVERPAYRQEYYPPVYRERRVYREDYAPRRYRRWQEDDY